MGTGNSADRMAIDARASIVPALLMLLFSSCSFGPPEIHARIANVRAKPDSHSFAVAVRYEKIQRPTGLINTFPNGGIPRILDEKAEIYLCDAETAEVRKLATVTPEQSVRLGWEPWVMGWVGENLYFQISGQSGTRLKDIQNSKPIPYCVNANGRLSKLEEMPDGLEFQSNTGPLPQLRYVRYSMGHSTVDVRTENKTEPRTLLRIESGDGALVPVVPPVNQLNTLPAAPAGTRGRADLRG